MAARRHRHWFLFLVRAPRHASSPSRADPPARARRPELNHSKVPGRRRSAGRRRAEAAWQKAGRGRWPRRCCRSQTGRSRFPRAQRSSCFGPLRTATDGEGTVFRCRCRSGRLAPVRARLGGRAARGRCGYAVTEECPAGAAHAQRGSQRGGAAMAGGSATRYMCDQPRPESKMIESRPARANEKFCSFS